MKPFPLSIKVAVREHIKVLDYIKAFAILSLDSGEFWIEIPMRYGWMWHRAVVLNYCVIFGSLWPFSHCDPPTCCDNFTSYKNKVKHFLLTFGLSHTRHSTKVKIKSFLFVFVSGQVVAAQLWVVVNLQVKTGVCGKKKRKPFFCLCLDFSRNSADTSAGDRKL